MLIRTGYVITEVNNGIYTIRLPYSGTTTEVCNLVPVPAGFIVSDTVSNNHCPLNSAYVIQAPPLSGATRICSSLSPLPSGFIFASYGDTSHCGGSGSYIVPATTNQSIVPTPFIGTEPNVSSKPADPVITCQVGTIDGGLLGSASKNSAGCN